MKYLEAVAYTSGDRVTCLICGASCRSVGLHAFHAHGMTAREYKLKFGLPVTKGLEAADVRQARAKAVRATRAAGKLPQTPPPDVSYRIGMPRPSYTSRDMMRVTPDSISRLMEHIRSGDTITEACRRPGVRARLQGGRG